jgi:hypothetical protein
MRFKLNARALRELCNSPAVVAELKRRASRIAAAAGEGMVVMPAETGRNRARVAVITATYRARHAEATSRALTRALDAGRG